MGYGFFWVLCFRILNYFLNSNPLFIMYDKYIVIYHILDKIMLLHHPRHYYVASLQNYLVLQLEQVSMVLISVSLRLEIGCLLLDYVLIWKVQPMLQVQHFLMFINKLHRCLGRG